MWDGAVIWSTTIIWILVAPFVNCSHQALVISKCNALLNLQLPLVLLSLSPCYWGECKKNYDSIVSTCFWYFAWRCFLHYVDDIFPYKQTELTQHLKLVVGVIYKTYYKVLTITTYNWSRHYISVNTSRFLFTRATITWS